MDKNENGYPGCLCGASCCCDGCQSTPGDNVNGADGNHTCGGNGSCLDNMPLAYAYAPDQRFRMLYSANDALKHGTLFEELYKPMEVYGRE